MLVLNKATHLRAWIEADNITIPAVAKGTDIQVSHNRIVMFFSDNGCELYATALGKRYTIQEQIQINGNFTVRNGKLIPEKPSHAYAQVKSDLAKQARAYHGSSDDPNPVRISDRVTGKDQIVIADGGIVTVSENLSNVLVKVIALPIVFPQVVSVSNDDVENFVVKLICSFSGETYLAIAPQCKLIPEHQESYAERRRVEFEYVAANVKFNKLKGST